MVPFGLIFVAGGLFSVVTALEAGDFGSVAFLSVLVVWGVLWTGYVLRLARAGVYVSSSGVQIRNILRTRTVPWCDVEGFSLATDGVPARLGWEHVCVEVQGAPPIRSQYPTEVRWFPLLRLTGGDAPARTVELLNATRPAGPW